MTIPPFTGRFTQQEPIGEDAIAAAVNVLRSGRLHRYNSAGAEPSEAALLEQEFAAYQGRRYCLACTSGGYSLQVALRAAGLKPGEQVLTNAFTLAPVPGAIFGAGGRPLFVETTRDLVIDLDDLERKASASGARLLLLSHMRGHLPNMEALSTISDRFGLVVIEDCAHTMGATWDGCKSGNFGLAGCFSTQTYKHMNSGEGGLLVSDDAEFMAKATIMSGSYMMYGRHGTAPDPAVFARIRLETPNFSGRMDNLRAAILRPQLVTLEDNVARWNERYRIIEGKLRETNGIYLPYRPPQERYVGSSIQFLIPGVDSDRARAFVKECAALGVELKWFGNEEPVGFTSTHKSWRYLDPQSLPVSDGILSELFDMRIPLTFSARDCEHIGTIIVACFSTSVGNGAQR